MTKLMIGTLFLSTGLLAGGVRQPLPPGEGSQEQEALEEKKSPFIEPQERSKRIRRNPGSWNPIVDLTDIFPGNRAMNRHGVFELYDAAIGVKLRVEQARRSKPLLDAVAEWEKGQFIGPLFIWEAEGHFHMIYECSRASSTCYARSSDGYHWERPNLGEVEFEGSAKNNILRNGIKGATGVFIDPHAPQAERFKAMGGDMAWYDPATLQPLDGEEAMRRWNAQVYDEDAYKGPRAEIWGRTLAWISADGRKWKELEEPLGNRPVNGGISARYDSHNDEYIAYQQIMGNTAELMPGIGTARVEEETQRRTIGFSRTKDFRRWPAPKLILAPDAQDDLDISFYGANYFPYPGRTDLHVMMIPVYHQLIDHVDTQIAFSRDGLFWSRPERRPIHTVGTPGSGEDSQVHTWRNGLVELPDGQWAMPYTGMSSLHNAYGEKQLFPRGRPIQIRYALWDPHRFIGMEADNEGRFTIPTIYRHGNQLRLNYRCAVGGWIQVELLRKSPSMNHADLGPVKGFSFADCERLTGDESARVVTWKGKSDLSGIGDTGAIRIKMFQAKLFAYKF